MSSIAKIHRNEYEITDIKNTPIAIAEAPGRIHFLGEEGQPQSAFFLSAAIDRCISLAVSHRKDNSFRFYASALGERKRSTMVNLKYRREDRWANYIKTAIFIFIDLGYPVKGLNFTFCGDIPQNIGLASSVAIETAAAMALKSLFRVQISDAELARKLFETHIKVFEKTVPLVDYQACIFAKKDQFLILDSSIQHRGTHHAIKRVASPFSKYKFFLIDSRVPMMGTESELASRRSDLLKGLKYLSKNHEGTAFKDFESNDLLDALGNFPEQIRRRTIHIVEEIKRVTDAAAALEQKNVLAFAKIIFHSHESLRDLYEISCPEVDWLVKRAQEIEGSAGSRMTGVGFGPSTYAIIPKDLADEYINKLEEYERIFGFRAVIYEVKLAGGAKAVSESKAKPVPEKKTKTSVKNKNKNEKHQTANSKTDAKKVKTAKKAPAKKASIKKTSVKKGQKTSVKKIIVKKVASSKKAAVKSALKKVPAKKTASKKVVTKKANNKTVKKNKKAATGRSKKSANRKK